MAMTLQASVNAFINERKDYYLQWMYDAPIIISQKHFQRICTLQEVLYKLIQEFVTNYDKYKQLMPLSVGETQILAAFQHKKYHIGTYRTDFVYGANMQEKAIEITCRFALNGIFLSFITEQVARNFKLANMPEIPTDHPHQGLMGHLENYLSNTQNVVVLKGSDIKNESKIFTKILERAGYLVKSIHFTRIQENHDVLKDALVISELALEEILSLDYTTVKVLAEVNLLNDFRTVFLVHDKRFFAVIGNDTLQKNALSAQEITLFKDFYIPTYNYVSDNRSIWENAKINKNDWIIKHRSLGKSQQVFAGSVTKEKEWQQLFERKDIDDMILQKWVHQKTIAGNIKDKYFNDFITGTLLFFDNHFFGFGTFRTSSHPVTNVVDDRKATSLILQNDQDIERIDANSTMPNNYNLCVIK